MDQFDDRNSAQSRANAGDPRRQKTLEDIMGSVRRSPNLREHKRRTIMSALRTVGRCLGKQLSELPGQPAALQKELATANPLQAGISHKRWRNIRSLTHEAFRISGANIMPSRWRRSVSSPAWAELRLACSAGSAYVNQLGLSRFMNFCGSRGIEPSAVDGAVFEDFRRHLTERSMVRNPATVYAQTCRIWDRAGERVLGWPAYRANLPAPSKGYSLDWSTFPESLAKDVEAFLYQKANPNILLDSYSRPIREATTIGRRKCLRQMATALAYSGFPIEKITSLAVLTAPDNAEAILTFFIDRAGGEFRDGLYTYACLLRTIARHWVKLASHTKIDLMCRNIGIQFVKNRGMKKRNRVRLRQFDSPTNQAHILNLPAKLMGLARQADIGGEASLSFATYAMAVEMLTCHPLRIKNLAELQIDRNIFLPKDPRHPHVIMSIDEADVKNGVMIERELPATTSAMLIAYVKEFRPRISDKPSMWLFPNPWGGRRNTTSFGAQISTVIMRHTGLIVNPHLFRGLAVKFIEQDNPGAMETARRLLGHKHIQTTIRAYSEGKTTVAHQQYEDLIERKRALLPAASARKVKP